MLGKKHLLSDLRTKGGVKDSWRQLGHDTCGFIMFISIAQLGTGAIYCACANSEVQLVKQTKPCLKFEDQLTTKHKQMVDRGGPVHDTVT